MNLKSISKFKTIFLLTFSLLFISKNTIVANELFVVQSQKNAENLNSSLKISDVVQFKVLQSTNKSEIRILLNTKENFKIYEDKLNFTYISANSLPYSINYTSTSLPETYFDPFYKKTKKIFKNGTEFIISLNKSKVNQPDDKLEIEVQSCSNFVCLVPAKVSLAISENAKSEEIKNSPSLFNKKNMEFEPSEKISMLNESIAFKIQEAIKLGSWILFPALFLAGLLMNLTPCVYPMIPITLNILGQFNKKNAHSKSVLKSLPYIYVAGIIVTYSILGVFAGMSGHIFGSQLANPIFNWIIAFIMLFLGLSMLGLFQFTKIQTLAHKIPLSQNYPRIAVATMGAISGFISAPCTGPVLSTILLLIAQNKNPISGFTYMLFFSIGFGLPYIALGLFGQRLSSLPKFPKLINFIKIFFASLMFALSLYYVRHFFQKIIIIQEIFVKPQSLSIIILILLIIIFSIQTTIKGISGIISKITLSICCTIFALWITLASTSSFYIPQKISNSNLNDNSLIHWQSSFEDAILLANKENKPIIIDVWAEWCSACLEMKETTWRNTTLINYLNKNFISVKLDYTDIPENIQLLINKWGINGLPAVLYFKSNSNINSAPDILYQGYSSANKILNAATSIEKKT